MFSLLSVKALAGWLFIFSLCATMLGWGATSSVKAQNSSSSSAPQQETTGTTSSATSQHTVQTPEAARPPAVVLKPVVEPIINRRYQK